MLRRFPYVRTLAAVCIVLFTLQTGAVCDDYEVQAFFYGSEEYKTRDANGNEQSTISVVNVSLSLNNGNWGQLDTRQVTVTEFPADGVIYKMSYLNGSFLFRIIWRGSSPPPQEPWKLTYRGEVEANTFANPGESVAYATVIPSSAEVLSYSVDESYDPPLRQLE